MGYKNFIIQTLESASKIANNKFGKVSGTVKKDDPNQVLTEADIEIGKLITENVNKEYPNHNIIDEEAGVVDKGSEFTWVIDPIDGTSNFAAGVPTYGIMIGLLKGDVPIAGGISLPYFSEIIIAEKADGAFSNGKKIHVSEEKELSKVLVAYGIDVHQYDPEFTKREALIIMNIVPNIRSLRATNSVFDSVLVAKGNYGAFLNQSSKIWDNVAQQIVIEEAGGIYTDFYGGKIDYSDPLGKAEQNFTFCAAAPAIHKQLQEIIREVE